MNEADGPSLDQRHDKRPVVCIQDIEWNWDLRARSDVDRRQGRNANMANGLCEVGST